MGRDKLPPLILIMEPKRLKIGDIIEGTYKEDREIITYKGVIIEVGWGHACVSRDDGKNGSGPNGEWEISKRWELGTFHWGANGTSGTIKRIKQKKTDSESMVISSSRKVKTTRIDKYDLDKVIKNLT